MSKTGSNTVNTNTTITNCSLQEFLDSSTYTDTERKFLELNLKNLTEIRTKELWLELSDSLLNKTIK